MLLLLFIYVCFILLKHVLHKTEFTAFYATHICIANERGLCKTYYILLLTAPDIANPS